MIFRNFPDFSLRDHDIDAPCPIYGFPNAVVTSRNSELHYPEHTGPLAILCNFGGHAEYATRRTRYVVDESSYLVMNRGQRFSNTIRSQTEVESMHIWFYPGFAESVLRDLTTPDDTLLDDPHRAGDQPVIFFEKLYSHDTALSPRLMRIRAAVHADTAGPGWLDEQFHDLLELLLMMHRGIGREIEQMPGVRHTTRVEIYRRLHSVRDFIHASLAQPVTIAEMAGVACMSPHHFIRIFKQMFGVTPHQYLTNLRLERARVLLVETDIPVTRICVNVGFKSPGSFNWLFRQRVGTPPDAYRKREARHN